MESLPQSIKFQDPPSPQSLFRACCRKTVPRLGSADLSELRHPSRIQRSFLCFALVARKTVPRLGSADLSELRHPSRIQRSFLWLSRVIGNPLCNYWKIKSTSTRFFHPSILTFIICHKYLSVYFIINVTLFSNACTFPPQVVQSLILTEWNIFLFTSKSILGFHLKCLQSQAARSWQSEALFTNPSSRCWKVPRTWFLNACAHT